MGRQHNHFGWGDLVLVLAGFSQSFLLVFKSLRLGLYGIYIEGANSSIGEDIIMNGIRHDQ